MDLTRQYYEQEDAKPGGNRTISEKRKRSSTVAHRFHLTKHTGYELKYPQELISRYGYHMWILLHMLLVGYDDHGTRVQGLHDGSLLQRKVQVAIDNIHNEPDSGEHEGSWELSRVKDFIVPRGIAEEGSIGSLFRIVTADVIAKWVLRERYTKVLAGTFSRFFYDEALRAVLVSLNSRADAEAFYGTVINAENLQEFGIELDWAVDEQDIRMLQGCIEQMTTVISVKILVPTEHPFGTTPYQEHLVPDYTLGHFNTDLIRQVVNNLRIQAFQLDILGQSGEHTDVKKGLRNVTTYEHWKPDMISPALCDMIRTLDIPAKTKTKLNFRCPGAEQGFYFIDSLLGEHKDTEFAVIKAVINSYEQITVPPPPLEGIRRSMRVRQWSSNTPAFANNLESLWLDIHTAQGIRTLQKLIKLNARLRKVRVTAETGTFYSIYGAVKKALRAPSDRLQMKLVLKDEQDTRLTWSDVAQRISGTMDISGAAEKHHKRQHRLVLQSQSISLVYTQPACDIGTVLMFFGSMITHLQCLDFTNQDAKILEASTRSKGLNIRCLRLNILCLNMKGLDDLAKVIQRSSKCLSALTGSDPLSLAVHLLPMDDYRPDWGRIANFVAGVGNHIYKLLLESHRIGNALGKVQDQDLAGFTAFLERCSTATRCLEVVIVRARGSSSAAQKSIDLAKSDGSSSAVTLAITIFEQLLTAAVVPWPRSIASDLKTMLPGDQRSALGIRGVGFILAEH
ncbi:hypothetical protein BGX28_009427 [Mortierella sp. GBA30]|nr:hypothetical protein BGX28_009427 [Mortierella sp. GBA30]